MGLGSWLSRKSLPAPGGPGVFYLNGNYKLFDPWKLNNAALEGYAGNPIVFACIRMIADAAASVKIEVHKTKANGDTEILSKHPLLDLMKKPNPGQTGKQFIREMVTQYLYAGETFILRLPTAGSIVKELYTLEPRLVTTKATDTGIFPQQYEYGAGADKIVYPVSQLTGKSAVKHIKTVNPLDPRRGFSPMYAAARHIDIHNEGSKWNVNLLANSARPSGVVEVPAGTDVSAITNLAQMFKKFWQGARNAGSVAFLTAGAKFTQTSLSPKDMEFSNSLNEAAKQIAMVYGVPLPLISNEAATFNNMDSAVERLWGDTVLPLLDDLLACLNDFLDTGDGACLTYNADSVSALEAQRGRKFDRMLKGIAGTMLTPNEAREEVGYDTHPSKLGDELLVSTMVAPLDDDKDPDDPNSEGSDPANDNTPPPEDDVKPKKNAA